MQTRDDFLTRAVIVIVEDVTMVENQLGGCMEVLDDNVYRSITTVDGTLVVSYAIINMVLVTEHLAICIC